MRKKIKSILKKVGFLRNQKPDILFDVVCGMELPAANAKYESVHKGDTYYFCPVSCKQHFDGDFEKYAHS